MTIGFPGQLTCSDHAPAPCQLCSFTKCLFRPCQLASLLCTCQLCHWLTTGSLICRLGSILHPSGIWTSDGTDSGACQSAWPTADACSTFCLAQALLTLMLCSRGFTLSSWAFMISWLHNLLNGTCFGSSTAAGHCQGSVQGKSAGSRERPPIARSNFKSPANVCATQATKVCLSLPSGILAQSLKTKTYRHEPQLAEIESDLSLSLLSLFT